MKVVIAPDSFKESLCAAGVAEAIAKGVLAACPDAQIDLCPMADGGEGTVDAMVAATGGKLVSADVYDPLGGEVRAKFGLLGKDEGGLLPGEIGLSAATAAADGEGNPAQGGTAVIEMAAASGLGLVPLDRRDPLRTSTYGTGQLIQAAIEAGVSEIILGIGGSATVDGGCGCAQALGVDFLDANGKAFICGMGGGALSDVAKIDIDGRTILLDKVKIRVACDVTNPLTGPQGAAVIFGPQKGATDEMVEQLEAGLAHLAELIRRDLDVDIEHLAGAGAAGGLGGGLVAFTGATLENGGKLVAGAIGLPRRVKGADICFTGEGRLDGQSRFGKVPVRVATVAGKAGVSTACIGGMVTDDAPRDLFRATRALVEGDITPKQAIANPAPLLASRAEAIMKEFMAS